MELHFATYQYYPYPSTAFFLCAFNIANADNAESVEAQKSTSVQLLHAERNNSMFAPLFTIGLRYYYCIAMVRIYMRTCIFAYRRYKRAAY